ncbi:MAG: NUDIX domain-containing protein [Geminicoccaceae bacterium]
MSLSARLKVKLASIILRHRRFNRWAHKQLPTKRMAAGVTFFNDAGRLLVVKPSYRTAWLIPGGIVERDESPWSAARREVMEEIGLDVDQLRLTAVDWRAGDDEFNESLHFLFDGGMLSKDREGAIRCDGIEIIDHRFVTRDEAKSLLEPHLGLRVITFWDQASDQPLVMTSGVPDPDFS